MPKSRPDPATRPAGPPPNRATLHNAALHHLARYAATEAGLVRVLDRRIARWVVASRESAEAAAPAYAAARDVARALAASGAVDDEAFAAARARRLLRAGRSRRAVAAHLAAKGVDPAMAGTVLPGLGDELLAALSLMKRRRFGSFRHGAADSATAQRELAALARAGFPRDVAERALRLDRDEAERLVLTLKQG